LDCSKYGEMAVLDLKGLWALEEETRRLEHMYAEATGL
jgi:hypothetical protein